MVGFVVALSYLTRPATNVGSTFSSFLSPRTSNSCSVVETPSGGVRFLVIFSFSETYLEHEMWSKWILQREIIPIIGFVSICVIVFVFEVKINVSGHPVHIVLSSK